MSFANVDMQRLKQNPSQATPSEVAELIAEIERLQGTTTEWKATIDPTIDIYWEDHFSHRCDDD